MDLALVDQLKTATVLVARILEGLESCGPVEGAAVIEARVLVDLHELLCTRIVDRFAKTGDYIHDGYPNVSAWLAAKTSAMKSEGVSRLTQADAMNELPVFGVSVQATMIGMTHIRLLAGVLNEGRLPYAVRDEEHLVAAAESLSSSKFREYLRYWAACCDNDMSDPSDADLIERLRRVSLHQLPDGSWKLDGRLDTLTGEALTAALEAAMPKPSPDDDRTITQKRHDALHDLASESLSMNESGVHGERPHVTVTVDADTGIAYTTGNVTLPAYLRNTIVCDATITTVWLSKTGLPFDVGTPETAIPIRNRRAVIARDRTCRFTGCCRPPRWSEIHHMKHREHGGTHELPNLLMLCRFHHRLVHRQNLKLSWDNDQVTLLIEWPNGVVLHSPPPMAFM